MNCSTQMHPSFCWNDCRRRVKSPGGCFGNIFGDISFVYRRLKAYEGSQKPSQVISIPGPPVPTQSMYKCLMKIVVNGIKRHIPSVKCAVSSALNSPPAIFNYETNQDKLNSKTRVAYEPAHLIVNQRGARKKKRKAQSGNLYLVLWPWQIWLRTSLHCRIRLSCKWLP